MSNHLPRVQQTFTNPATVREALQRRDFLRTSIEEIQSQLSNEHRRDPITGQRMELATYQVWRTGAIRALSSRTTELRFVKSWLRDQPMIDARVLHTDCGTPVTTRPALEQTTGDELVALWCCKCGRTVDGRELNQPGDYYVTT